MRGQCTEKSRITKEAKNSLLANFAHHLRRDEAALLAALQ
jgi:hypothetical protein